jgi:hypothetical protein
MGVLMAKTMMAVLNPQNRMNRLKWSKRAEKCRHFISKVGSRCALGKALCQVECSDFKLIPEKAIALPSMEVVQVV